ncbi:MAG TPA: SlyX family protein [Desulfopila sp.]|nr:SlyX family protein [Desulfopila sp.]
METISGVDKRLMSVEEKIEYQEYTIEKLNDVIFSQQQQLSEMEQWLKLLEERLVILSGGATEEDSIFPR